MSPVHAHAVTHDRQARAASTSVPPVAPIGSGKSTIAPSTFPPILWPETWLPVTLSRSSVLRPIEM